MGRREISRNEQFLRFPQCFNRRLLQTRKNQGLFEKGLKFETAFGKDKKHCVKRRVLWFPSLSLFPTMFSKGFFLRAVKSRDCVGTGKDLNSFASGNISF